jgi:formate dehydrogenase major subunit
MLHMLHAKETGCKMIVVDPRFTRTAAKADEYVRIRSGSDIPFLFGLLHHIFKNGWEDKKYINDRVYGMDKVKEEVLAKWTPDKVEEACGVKEEQVLKVAKMLHDNRPAPWSGAWAKPSTPSATPWCVLRASCNWRWAMWARAVAAPTSSVATTTCRAPPMWAPTPIRCPATTAWPKVRGSTSPKCGVWTSSGSRSSTPAPAMMSKPGITVSRWIDGVLEKNELIDQDSNLRGVFYWGHAPNSQTRGLEMKRAMDKLDLLVVVDPYPSATAAMAAMPGKPEDLNPNRAVYLLPAATQFETSGSCTASNRSHAVAREGH